MSYTALYRLWRPQDFDSLIGQDHISRTLKNALIAGRIAHAYLFAGPRGTGKTSTAKVLAKALNCVDGPTPSPCNVCANCTKINQGNSMDVFEIDAASNRGIDEIRNLRETIKFTPVDGRYKVYIIDEVHMLTSEAFNALLKTLEEPPPHVVFVLATTEPHKIPATIHSRCQRYDFRRIAARDIEGRLAEVTARSGIEAEPQALRLIAFHADGGLRDALSLLDQTAIGAERVTTEKVRRLLGLIGHEGLQRLVDAMAGRDPAGALVTLDEMFNNGKDLRQIMLELAQYARTLMLFRAAPDLDAAGSQLADPGMLAAHAARFSEADLARMMQVFHDAANEVREAAEPRITAEMALLSFCREETPDLHALARRVTELEAMLTARTELDRRPSAAHRPAGPAPTAHRPHAVLPAASSPAAPVAPTRPVASAAPPKPEAASGTPDIAKAPPVKPAASADLSRIWEDAMGHLLSGNKRAVHACVSQGKLTALSAGTATVQLPNKFTLERTEKEDYRAIVEKVLGLVCGQPVRLRCTLESEQVSASPPAPAGEQPQEKSAAVLQAEMMFGGKAKAMDETIEED